MKRENSQNDWHGERDRRICDVLQKYEGATPSDELFMQAALELAALGAEEDEVPVGCVIVREGKILTGDYNGRETFRDPLYHAESAAIHRASAILGGWRLVGCTLYVTLEPCPMCGGAIWAARVPRVVIGTRDPKAGAAGSMMDLYSYPLNHKPELTFGVLEEECRHALRSFFEEKRRRGIRWKKNAVGGGQPNEAKEEGEA